MAPPILLLSSGKCFTFQPIRLPRVEDIQKAVVFSSESVDSLGSPFWNDFEGSPPNLDLESVNVNELMVTPLCPIAKETCSENDHYRQINGFCNNKRVPTWGFSGDILTRLLPPHYDFGMMRMKSSNGLLLPNPRIVSNSLKLMKRRSHPIDVNILWLFFGQFLDHDISFTPLALEGKDLKVCEECDSWQTNSACAPILVPLSDDSIPHSFPNGQRNCIPFVRSAAIPSTYQNKPALEQLNFNTAYIDLSSVYGSDRCTEREVRLFRYGQLIEQRHPLDFQGMLPTRPIEPFRDCRSVSGRCPKAGDHRPLENLFLHLFHVIFLREHNRIARNLYHINKHWSDERLYQESRRINIAQYQRIVYEEFLPILLGDKLMKTYKLYPSSKKTYFKGYDLNINPQILTEFTTAAFRVGHTMIPDHLIEMNEYYLPLGSLPLETLFRNDSYIYNEDFLENLARGMMATKVEAVDPVIERSVTDKLFIKNGNTFTSQDLISLNIARGRDHGIPGFTAYRQLCNLSPVRSWNDMKIFPHDLSLLKRMYSSIHDIDLFVGGLTELPQGDSVVGPTFGCIIAQQFLRLKLGDYFWFENEENHLTIDQIQSIKESSAMSRILFMNLGSLIYAPKFIFKMPDRLKNSLKSIKIVKDIDFSLWEERRKGKESKTCHFKDKIYKIFDKIEISPCVDCSCNNSTKVSCSWNYENCKRYRADDEDSFCKMACGS